MKISKWTSRTVYVHILN